MPWTNRWLRGLGSAALVCVTLASCGESDPMEPEEDPIASITVTPANDTIDIEGTTTLTARVLTEGGSDVTSSTTITWSSLAGSIAGVSGSGATATVTGLLAGLAEIRASAGGVNGSASIRVNGPPPAITTTTLPSGEVDVAYDQTLAATGGNGTYAWSVSSGTLPGGLTLGASTGAITGTPTTAGDFTFTVQVASDGRTDSQELSLTVAPAGGNVSDVVINVDFLGSVDIQYDTVYAGDDAVFSTAGGTSWNAVDPFTSVTNAVDQFGDPTVVDVIENVSGTTFIGAAIVSLQAHGISGGGIPENGFRIEGLEAGGVYDLAFYVYAEVSLSTFTTLDVTHAGGETSLGPNEEPTWALPGEEDKDYLLLEDVSPYEISPGVYGFLIDNLNDEGVINAVQLRGPARAP